MGYNAPQYIKSRSGCGGCYIPIWAIILVLAGMFAIFMSNDEEDTGQGCPKDWVGTYVCH